VYERPGSKDSAANSESENEAVSDLHCFLWREWATKRVVIPGFRT
jgi:hypothetical protein